MSTLRLAFAILLLLSMGTAQLSADTGGTLLPGGALAAVPAINGNPGVVLSSQTSSGAAANVSSAVLLDSATGAYDFYYQIFNVSPTNASITDISASAFTGLATSVGYLTSGSSIIGASFVNSSIGPAIASRTADGSSVQFHFAAPLLSGQASAVLVVSTNATVYAAGMTTLAGSTGTSNLRSLAPVASAGISGNGGLFVVSATAHDIFEYDQTTGAFVRSFDSVAPYYPYGLALGSDGYLYTARTDAVNDYDSHVDRFDPRTGSRLASFGSLPQTRGLTIGPDNLIYVSAFNSDQIWRYDPVSGTFLDVAATIQGPPYSFALDSTGNLFVNNGSGTIYKVDAATHAISTFIADPNLVSYNNEAMVFGPDGNLYLGTSPFSSYAHQVRRYKGETGTFDSVFAQDPHIDEATSLAFGQDGRIYVGTVSGNILRFDQASGTFLDVFIPQGSGGLDSNITGVVFASSPSTTGTIYATSNLAAATFTITGPATYQGSGTSFSQPNAPAGTYTLHFVDVQQYATPLDQTGILKAGGTLTFAEGIYTPIKTGTITVNSNLPQATFSISPSIPNAPTGGPYPATAPNVPAGTYTVTFNSLPGYTVQQPLSQMLSSGGAITFIGNYQSNPTLFGPPSPTNPQATIAEPVSTATGNYFSSHTDIAVRGKGLPFVFTRFYNSLSSATGPLGVGWSHSFTIALSENALTGNVTDTEADGHTVTFTAAGGGAFMRAPGVFDNLRKNADGFFTLARKNQTLLTFSATGRLLSIVDRNGNTQLLTYDSGGRLMAVIDSAGRSFTFSYNAAGHLTSLTDPIGRILRYSYDPAGNLISYQDALGGLTQYSYDASHRLTAAIDPRGNTYLQNTYDSQGRVAAQKNARNFTTTFAYNTPSAGTTTITDPLGNAVRHVYDASLRIVAEVDALGGTTSYVYNANNLKTSVIDALGRVRSYSYDSNGNATSITDPTGKTSTFTYDAKNNLFSVTDRLGRITAFAYDGNGNLLTSTDPAGSKTTFTYDAYGEVLTAKNARGFSTAFQYDAAGNLTKLTDALAGTVVPSYDAAGRMTSLKDQLGNTTTRSYDANNRLLNVTDPLGSTTTFSYDSNGNLTKIADANGNQTRYAYDSTNKLSQVTDAIGGITQYQYNGNADLISVIDAGGHSTGYTYDGVRRLVTIIDPLGRQQHYSYDAVGNVTATTDGNNKTNAFTYDSMNRLVSKALSDGKSVSYTYDAVGNRISMADWRGTTLYSSDILNRVTSVATPDGKTVRYGYDAVGDRISLTNGSGKTVQYQYDAVNRISTVTDWNGNTTSYGYDAAGNRVFTTMPNRTASTYSYDAANRLLSVTNTSKNSTLSSFTYLLDRVGNRLHFTSSRGDVTNYGYDSLYRLTSWTTPGGVLTQYTYDAVGNRLTVTGPNGVSNYSYDAADQLLSAGSATFTYDGNGNQVKKTTAGTAVNYSWDALNRLISVTGGGIKTQYAYDGDGSRVQQLVASGTYQYINDVVNALPVVLDEDGPDGNIEYVHGLTLISESTSQHQYSYQVDGLGSVVTITNEAGAHQANFGYDPWGESINPAEPPIGLDALGTKNKYKFTGEAQDPDSGLLFLRARYYDASVGRFINRDPLAGTAPYPQSQNRYAYALSNPTRFNDIAGLSAVEFNYSKTRDISDVIVGITNDIGHHLPDYKLTPVEGGFEVTSNVAGKTILNAINVIGSYLSAGVTVYQEFHNPNEDPALALGVASAKVLISQIPVVGELYGLAGIVFPKQTDTFNGWIGTGIQSAGNDLGDVILGGAAITGQSSNFEDWSSHPTWIPFVR